MLISAVAQGESNPRYHRQRLSVLWNGPLLPFAQTAWPVPGPSPPGPVALPHQSLSVVSSSVVIVGDRQDTDARRSDKCCCC